MKFLVDVQLPRRLLSQLITQVLPEVIKAFDTARYVEINQDSIIIHE